MPILIIVWCCHGAWLYMKAMWLKYNTALYLPENEKKKKNWTDLNASRDSHIPDSLLLVVFEIRCERNSYSWIRRLYINRVCRGTHVVFPVIKHLQKHVHRFAAFHTDWAEGIFCRPWPVRVPFRDFVNCPIRILVEPQRDPHCHERNSFFDLRQGIDSTKSKTWLSILLVH